MKKDRWIGWFRPIKRGYRIGPVFFVPIELTPQRRDSKKSPVVITVSQSCGSAVQRNKWRRIVRAYLRKVGASQQEIWIRLSPQHRLSKKILLKEWEPVLCSGLEKLGLSKPSSSSIAE